ncbi:YheC/YheD family protein [Brevibacillus massiliensis]|jgi:hypothetical protein|uniref:YheC/YheD family endospore coat-associated protein n=1 Tax=Brevibacillus massiliensis TaxID=1118054 RepID=UPI0002E50DBF|nr:YheC/YheD family protein [Brevibacillus massiliensis]
MDSILVRLRFFTHQNVPGIVIPLGLCQKLQLEPRQQVTISLGKRAVSAIVFQDRKNPEGNVIRMTSTLRKELSVPHPGLIHLKQEGDVLRIGPAIGILTTGLRYDSRRPIGMRTSFFRDLLQAQKGRGVYYYIFSPDDIDWTRNLVNAWFLRPTREGEYVWRNITAPLPDVVYDRVPSRTAEKQDKVRFVKEKLENEINLPIFNSGFFNKWGVHKLLYPLDEVNEFIPETHNYASLENLRRMMRKYRMVYLKPKNGSLGIGILKVMRTADHSYEVSYHTSSGNIKRTFNSAQTLYQRIFRSRKPSAYLVQQGINLHTYHGRPFDFRVHLHKNQENNWVVSCMAAKVAGSGSVTTHVRTGGTVIPGSDLLQSIFGNRRNLIEERISSAAVRIAAAIEEAMGIPLGELGLDMGIDKHGHVWMFEANSKPGRSIFKHSRLKKADEFSRNLLVDYSCYLANF